MNFALSSSPDVFGSQNPAPESGTVPLPFDLGVVVPVREGSLRMKSKVLLPFGEDLTLLEWKLEQLCQVVPAGRIYVSTDSDALRRLAAPYGVNFHERAPRPCRSRGAAFAEVITGIVQAIPHAHVAWVSVAVPLMGPAEYYRSFMKYHQQVLQRGDFDSLFAANLTKEYPGWPDGRLNDPAGRRHPPGQDRSDIYLVTNSLYLRDRESILRDGGLLGPKPFQHLGGNAAGADPGAADDFQTACHVRPFPQRQAVATAVL